MKIKHLATICVLMLSVMVSTGNLFSIDEDQSEDQKHKELIQHTKNIHVYIQTDLIKGTESEKYVADCVREALISNFTSYGYPVVDAVQECQWAIHVSFQIEFFDMGPPEKLVSRLLKGHVSVKQDDRIVYEKSISGAGIGIDIKMANCAAAKKLASDTTTRIAKWMKKEYLKN